MKIAKIALIIISINMLTGCETIKGLVKSDLYHDGGIAGEKLDKHFFNAKSGNDQLLRAVTIVALASRVAVGTLKDGDDSNAFISRLRAASTEINYLGGDLFGRGDPAFVHCPQRSTQTNCDTRAALFESNLPQLEYKIGRLTIAALPQKAAVEFADAAVNGNVLSSAWKFLKLAAASLDGGHRGAAAYRSTLEVLSIYCPKLANGAEKDRHACTGVNGADRTIELAETVADEDDARFYALFDLMRTSCKLLPINLQVENGGSVLDARADDCDDLQWKPRARFDGLQPKAKAAIAG